MPPTSVMIQYQPRVGQRPTRDVITINLTNQYIHWCIPYFEFDGECNTTGILAVEGKMGLCG
jgi:hypothetical protein